MSPVMGKSVKESAMPKEYIYSMDHGRWATPEGGDLPVLVNEDGIKLGWSKESEHVGLAVVDMAKDPDGFEAQHINLDRAGINRLIKFLRRARDDAFGRDE